MLKYIIPLVLTLTFAAPASAVTLVTPSGKTPQPYQRWAARAAVPTPPGTLLVHTVAGCPTGEMACANGDEAWIAGTQFDKPGFYHELGHVYDFRVLTEALHRRFAAIMGHPWAKWWTDNIGRMYNGQGTLGEWFAEGYSLCAARVTPDGYPWGDNYNPTQDQQRQVCSLIRRSGGWYMNPGGAPR